jgi:endonuclease/exonuclease/phosphatase family metal-dependent hydrolase
VAVLGLMAVLALGVWVASASGGASPGPAPTVLTAPTSTASPEAPEAGHDLLPPLDPSDRTGESGCAVRDGRVVRVLQLNIHFGTRRGGGVDLAALADEITAVHPDLVGLNEVDNGTLRTGRLDEARYLAGVTGLDAVYGPNLPWEGGLFGNAVLTRVPVLGSHNLRLPVTDGLERRGLLTVTVRIGGRIVSFSSAHLTDGDDGRASRVEQAAAIVAALGDASYPTIVAGDLNAEPSEPPVRILRQHLLDAQELGGTGAGDTIPEPSPHSRFDYVMYDDGFAVVPGSTRVLPSSSDHRAVFTELALLPARCAP